MLASPVPTQTMSGLAGEIARAPTEWVPLLSKTGRKVVPLFVVFQRPPVAKPTRKVWGSSGWTARSSTRPPCPKGPMERHEKALSRGWSDWLTGGGSSSCWAETAVAGMTAAATASAMEESASVRSGDVGWRPDMMNTSRALGTTDRESQGVV